MKRVLLLGALLVASSAQAQDVPAALAKLAYAQQELADAQGALNDAKAALLGAPRVTISSAIGAQAAIDGAPAGATIVLDSSQVYPPLTLSGPGRLLVSSGGSVTGRVQPGATLAKVAHLDITGTGWVVRGVEVTGDTSRVEAVWCDPSASHVALDQILSRGHDQIRRAVALECMDASVTRSYLYNYAAAGVETQAVGGHLGPGPYLIEDNYLEAASENILFGGGDPLTAGVTPSDITIRKNLLMKPASWRGQSLNVKNLLELKHAKRVLIEDNVLDGSWLDAQIGFGVVLTVRNQDGGCYWCTVQDVVFHRNTVRNVGGGVNILGLDSTPGRVSVKAARILIDANSFALTPTGGDVAKLYQIINGPDDLTISNNTSTLVGYLGAFLTFGGLPATRFTFAGNDVDQGDYGITGDGTSIGKPTVDIYNPGGYTWSGVTVRHAGFHAGEERWLTYPVGTVVK